MKAKEIYQKYTVPSNLQEHHYRVAAVALFILNNWKSDDVPDKKLIITELLLHDVGNLIKCDLDHQFHLLGESEAGREEYWREKRSEFIKKWGEDENTATQKIMRDVGVSQEVISLFNRCGSQRVEENTKRGDWAANICTYSDLRVAPTGVVSVNERWDDALSRYKDRRDHPLSRAEEIELRRKFTLLLEEQIQEKVSHPLAEITDRSITSYIEEARAFEVV